MIKGKIAKFAQMPAVIAMVTRSGAVGVNFAVIAGLAAGLGFDDFGRLVLVWSGATVCAPCIGAGAPLILLDAMSKRHGLHRGVILRIIFVWPAILGVSAYCLLSSIWPGYAWGAMISAGYCINFLTCLASIMRTLGSVNMSMVLRDACPHVALGFAAMIGYVDLILPLACTAMVGMGGGAIWWLWQRPERRMLLSGADISRKFALSLWGTSVLGVVVSQVDIIFGGSFLSPAQLGVYALLRRISNLVALPISVATWVTAGAVATSHANADKRVLQNAICIASSVAFFPGTALFVVVAAISLWIAPDAPVTAFVLLAGAFIQIMFAATFTVATLCECAHFAMMSRLLSIIAYLLIVTVGTVDTALSNALAYVVAIAAGQLVLWHLLRTRLGVDTSVWVLWRERGAKWSLS